MRASRIFDLARTIRCATVGGVVRKARAISSVVRPHTSRSVSATCASGGSEGWQQVKTSRRRSSPNPAPFPPTASRGSNRPRPGSRALRLLLAEVDDRPHLDAAGARRRDPAGDLQRLVQVLGLDQVEPAELLLGLGERAVGGGQLAVADAYRRRR